MNKMMICGFCFMIIHKGGNGQGYTLNKADHKLSTVEAE